MKATYCRRVRTEDIDEIKSGWSAKALKVLRDSLRGSATESRRTPERTSDSRSLLTKVAEDKHVQIIPRILKKDEPG